VAFGRAIGGLICRIMHHEFQPDGLKKAAFSAVTHDRFFFDREFDGDFLQGRGEFTKTGFS
jgi:hypothetical protein